MQRTPAILPDDSALATQQKGCNLMPLFCILQRFCGCAFTLTVVPLNRSIGEVVIVAISERKPMMFHQRPPPPLWQAASFDSMTFQPAMILLAGLCVHHSVFKIFLTCIYSFTCYATLYKVWL